MASVIYDKCIMAKVLWQMKLSPLHYNTGQIYFAHKNRSIVEVNLISISFNLKVRLQLNLI